MPYYVTILKGRTAAEAEPILAMSDPRAVQAVRRAIYRLLTEETPQRKAAGILKCKRTERME